MRSLVNWSWPGNVRELENFMERSVILSPGPELRAPLAELESAGEPANSTDVNLEAAEREHILRVLRECKGMIGGTSGAAERLGLKRTTLNSKLKKLGIERRGDPPTATSIYSGDKHERRLREESDEQASCRSVVSKCPSVICFRSDNR